MLEPLNVTCDHRGGRQYSCHECTPRGRCQKCSKTTVRHDLYHCTHCKADCCLACLDKQIVALCGPCAVQHRSKEIAMRRK